MLLTQSNFNRIKNEESYKINFSSYETVEEFNNYVKEILEVENINILINNIIRIMNIINETNEDNSELEIKELILKANLSENSENFKEALSFLGKSSDEKILRINRIIDKKILDNLDNKINLLIKLEKLSTFFYPNFSDKIVMNTFTEKLIEKKVETTTIIDEDNTYTEPVSKTKIITISVIGLVFIFGLFYTFYMEK